MADTVLPIEEDRRVRDEQDQAPGAAAIVVVLLGIAAVLAAVVVFAS